MAQWKEFWLLPAGMAAAILVAFALLFHEKDDGRAPKEKSIWERDEAAR
jgi:hypothetical protein